MAPSRGGRGRAGRHHRPRRSAAGPSGAPERRATRLWPSALKRTGTRPPRANGQPRMRSRIVGSAGMTTAPDHGGWGDGPPLRPLPTAVPRRRSPPPPPRPPPPPPPPRGGPAGPPPPPPGAGLGPPHPPGPPPPPAPPAP